MRAVGKVGGWSQTVVTGYCMLEFNLSFSLWGRGWERQLRPAGLASSSVRALPKVIGVTCRQA